MTISPVSPIEDLNAAIQSHNPFNKPAIVKDQDVWGKGFPDVSSLNAHASDAVFHAINRVRTSQSSQDKVTSLVITAQQGVGKSHIISRIRHKLELEGGALFVYASVDKYGDLNLIKYQFQQTLADSLKHIGSQRVMQWQEVATAMVNEAEKASKPDAKTLSPEQLAKNFDKVYDERLAKGRKNLIDDLQGKILKNKQNADPYIVRAILWTLSESKATYAIKWLSGEELAPKDAADLGLPLPNPNKTNQDREAEALNTIRQILNLVSNTNPVLICFDELDTLKCSDAGFTTPQVIADLVKNLFDTLHQSELSQGVVMLTVMMPDTWTKTVKQLGGGIPDRVAAAGKPIDLKHMDGDSIVELVTLWLDEFYKERNLTPHERVYPFEKSQLLELGEEKPTVRKVLQWCAENFKVYEEPLPTNPFERFELALARELEVDIGNILEDNFLIARAIYFGFERLKGQTVEGVSIENVTYEIQPKGDNRGFIKFKIIGSENGKEVKIGVAVNQPTMGKSLKACLQRLTDYKRFDLTRGCLVRSKGRINRRSESYRLLERLTSELGGEFVELKEDDIRPLIAVRSVFQKSRDYKLTEEQVFDFISQKQLVFGNPLLQEILSDPSGQIPEDVVDDSLSLSDEIDSLPSADDTADEDDMEDDLSDEFNGA